MGRLRPYPWFATPLLQSSSRVTGATLRAGALILFRSGLNLNFLPYWRVGRCQCLLPGELLPIEPGHFTPGEPAQTGPDDFDALIDGGFGNAKQSSNFLAGPVVCNQHHDLTLLDSQLWQHSRFNPV